MHKLFALTFVLCLLSAAPAGAQQQPATGLETDNYKEIKALVSIDKDADTKLITEDTIRTTSSEDAAYGRSGAQSIYPGYAQEN